MSIKTMSRVWESSSLGGTELLLLLAVADFANDGGEAWPSVAALAKKIRMSERNTRYLLKKIEGSGELEILKNRGPRGCNIFRVQILQGANLSGVQPVAVGGAMDGRGGVQPTAPEPSVNRQQPSTVVPGQAGDPCPHQAILDLYHELLPAGRRVRIWNETRRAKLRARWREDVKRQSLAWWRKFLGYIAESQFLTGKASTPGRKPFEIDLEWIVTPANFVKIIEGKYHQEAGE